MRSTLGILAVLVAVGSTTSCLSKLPEGDKTLTSSPAPTAQDTNETTYPDRSAEIASREDALREVRAERGRQTVELQKQQAHVARLEEQLQRHQRLLEDAIHEVVRARAKQRSVESRAEAASEIAEAEIALVATAHHMLRIMLAMLQTGELWRSDQTAA